jgi:carbamoyltransferase
MSKIDIALNPCIAGLNYHDPSVAVSINNDLVFVAEEERYNKRKHSPGSFPINALEDAIRRFNIDYNHKVDIWISFDPALRMKSSLADTLYAENLLNNYLDKYFSNHQIHFLSHHLCHAAAAYHYSNAENAISYVFDGASECASASIYEVNNQKFKLLHQIPIDHSLAYLYSGITKLIGFEPWDQEGKTMALAPYGEIDPKVLNYLETKQWVNDLSSCLKNGSFIDINNFVSRIQKSLPIGEQLYLNRNIACCVQYYVAKELKHIIQSFTKQKYKNILSGGLFLNCKVTNEVFDSIDDHEYYVHPTPGDNGTAIGALCLATKFNISNIYPHYSTNNTVDYLPKSTIDTLVEFLYKGKIGIIFEGDMEFGPRALGHRSIIANPSINDISLRTNKIKNRESWRPFALSTTNDIANSIFYKYIDDNSAKYMIKTYQVKEHAIESISQAVHSIDKTCRPQVVDSIYNNNFYRLIKAFTSEASCYGILNTSLNDRGVPILKTRDDAKRFFYNHNVEFALIDGKIYTK